MITSDLPSLQAIFVCDSDTARLTTDAFDDCLEFRLDLAQVRTLPQLLATFSHEFLLPREPTGLDALLDQLSDLDWLAREGGYVIRTSGVDNLFTADQTLLAQLIRLFPYLCDRWRSRNTPFYVVLGSSGQAQSVIRQVLAATNEELEMASQRPWLGDVRPVVVHDYTARS